MPGTLPATTTNTIPPNRKWIWPFELIEQIGEGGMGVVYRARYVVNNREVAVKMLPADVTDPIVLQRFERELEVLKSLKHANIVRCFGGQCEDKARFYAMELVSGGTLESELQRKGRIGWETVLSYGEQICNALAAAHAQGVVHRDIKPSNFLMTPEGQLKLSDFGLATMSASRKITQAGKTAGTFLYMAPEQIRGQEVTPRTDLYALGCMFYELLTGKPPFIGETPAATLHMHLKTPTPRVATTVLDCPAQLDDLVGRLMEKDPAKRPSSAEEVAYTLHAITPTIEVRSPKRSSDTPPRGMAIRKEPVRTRRLTETSEGDIPAALPSWMPMALATTIVLSLLLNLQLIGSFFAGRSWESSYIAALENSSPIIRSNAALELGKSSYVSNRGLEAIAGKLADPASEVRVAAAQGLGSAGRWAKSYVTALHKLQKEHEDPMTRAAAGEAEKAINESSLRGGGGLLQILAWMLGISVLAAVWFRDSDAVRGMLASARKLAKPA